MKKRPKFRDRLEHEKKQRESDANFFANFDQKNPKKKKWKFCNKYKFSKNLVQTIEERKIAVFSLESTHKGEGGSEGQD